MSLEKKGMVVAGIRKPGISRDRLMGEVESPCERTRSTGEDSLDTSADPDSTWGEEIQKKRKQVN